MRFGFPPQHGHGAAGVAPRLILGGAPVSAPGSGIDALARGRGLAGDAERHAAVESVTPSQPMAEWDGAQTADAIQTRATPIYNQRAPGGPDGSRAHLDLLCRRADRSDIPAASPTTMQQADGDVLTTCAAGVPPVFTTRGTEDPAFPTSTGIRTLVEVPDLFRPSEDSRAQLDLPRGRADRRDGPVASPATLRKGDGEMLATCTAGVSPAIILPGSGDPALPATAGTDAPPLKKLRTLPPDDDLEMAILASILDLSKQQQDTSDEQRRVHERHLEDKLRTQNLRREVVIADGNCFYRALATHLYGDQERHMEARTLIVTEVMTQPDPYTPSSLD